MTKIRNKLIVSLLLVLMLLMIFSIYSLDRVSAATNKELKDGKYEVNVINDLPMGKENFSDKAIIEKQGENCYLTITIFDATQVKNFRMSSKTESVGTIMRKEGRQASYTYSLSEDELYRPISFSGFIPAMKKEITATIKLNFTQGNYKRIANEIDNLGDRPARYIPNLQVNLSDGEVEKGSMLILPIAKSTFEGETLDPTIKAYYVKDGEKVNIDTTSGKLIFNEVGEYHIEYRVESDKYKTLNGNNTFNEIDITIIAKIGASSIAKLNDEDLDKVQVQANYVIDDNEINKVQDKIKKIADRFEIINITFFKSDNNDEISEDLSLYLRCNDSYNKNKIIVYYVEENGNLLKLENQNYGRYVLVNSNKDGNYIICEEGVKVVMPMWGYALITSVIVVLILTIIIVPIIIKFKNKKRGS